MLVFLNGEFLPEPDARISVLDRGFLLGDGVFETLAIFGGRIFRAGAHLRRLAGGARMLGIDLPEPLEAMEARLEECARRNNLGDGLLRLTLSRGQSARGLSVRDAGPPTYVIAAFPPKLYPRSLLETGARLHLAGQRRLSGAGALNTAKTLSYLPGVLAFREAELAGADEAVLLNERGEVVGCAAANLFWVKDGVIRTPTIDCGALPGVTRQAAMQAVQSFGLMAEEAVASLAELYAADEIFFTSTTALVMPVGRIGEREFPAPGRFTTATRIALLSVLETECGPFWGLAED